MDPLLIMVWIIMDYGIGLWKWIMEMDYGNGLWKWINKNWLHYGITMIQVKLF
jgi:hypothetical protein